jgi:ubiquinone/menaquinone biosynthesis C-methylase UbiE
MLCQPICINRGILNERNAVTQKLKEYYDRIGESRASWVAKDRCSQIRISITAKLLARRLREGDTIVDVGCGSGEVFAYLSKLHKRYQAYFVGLDISSGATRVARRYADDCIIYDAERIPLRSDVADAVICVAVLEHLINPELCVKEIVRISKTGAYVIVQVPNKDSLLSKLYPKHNCLEHLHSFTIRSLTRVLKAHNIYPVRVFSDAITALPFLKQIEAYLLEFKPGLGDNIFVEAYVRKGNS